MTNRFLISVAAAALIAGTGFANAQGTGTSREAPSTGSTVQQSSPSSERGGVPSGAMNRDTGGSSGMKASESDEKAQPGASSKSAQDSNMPGQKPKGMSSENGAKGGKDMKAEGREGHDRMNAQSREGQTGTTGQSREGQTGTMNAQGQTKSPADRSQTTTGNAATSATAAPPAEKRTQIVSAIKSEKVEEVKDVNFNLSVGATVPTTVRFHPLPARIVEIYPEWRGYQFILVHGRYVIVRPETHEIVYIIES
jgi:hypothetical protein